MARKEKTITLRDEEQELTFKIKQMSAVALERWLIQVALLLCPTALAASTSSAIKELTSNISKEGFVALLNALSGVEYAKAEPLLNDLLNCCSRVVENVEERCTPQTVDNYIMDVRTLFKLRIEAAKLNLGFMLGEGGLLYASPEKPNTAAQ